MAAITAAARVVPGRNPPAADRRWGPARLSTSTGSARATLLAEAAGLGTPPNPRTAVGGIGVAGGLRSRGRLSVRASVQGSSSDSKIATDNGDWTKATLVENRAASADETIRTLVLSVEDKVPFMDGRKVKHYQDVTRWIDDYQIPGQHVNVKLQGNDSTNRKFSISCSPYTAQAASANLAAGIIEIMVEDTAGEVEAQYAGLEPGAPLEVGKISGAGFASIFDAEVSLQQSLEDGRSLLMIAQGTDGIASLRACVEWTPVQAHATEHHVAVIYLCKSPGAAAYLKDWDSWREAGITVKPVYYDASEEKGSAQISDEEALDRLALTIYKEDNGLAGTIGGTPSNCAVLMAGLNGTVSAAITKRLTSDGVHREWIWRC